MANGYLGAGKIKVAPYSDSLTFYQREFRDVGNASALNYSFTEEKKELLNYRDAAGGVADSYSRIDKFTITMDLREFTADNLAQALWGTTAAVNATPVVDEAGYKCQVGKFVPFKRAINTTVAPVVKEGATTVDTADYTVSAGGLTWASTLTTSGLADGDAVTISYTPLAGNDAQALITAAPSVSIFFEGVNANTNKVNIVRFWKVKLGVLEGFDAIGEDYGTLKLTGEVLKDETITDSGVSQFMNMEIAS